MGWIVCPHPKHSDIRIQLPDEWLGIHAERRDEAIEQYDSNMFGYEGDTLKEFAVALALLDDWENIPGIDGPPDKWDLSQIPLEVIGWVNTVVLSSFAACWIIPGN